MILLEIASRHLLGCPPGRFLRTRLPRFAAQAALLLAVAFGALRSALAGHPFLGLVGAFAAFAAGLVLLRLAFGPPPPGARGAYASVVAYVAVLGIAVASASVLVVISVMDGLQADIRASLLKTTPHIVGRAIGGVLEESEPLLRRLRAIDGVTSAWGRIEGNFLLTGPSGVPPVPIELDGVPRDFFDRRDAPEVVDGTLEAAYGGAGGAVFGLELARRLGLAVGDEVRLVSSAGRITPFGVVPATHRVRVAALFRSGFYEVDANRIYAPLPVARRLFALPGDAVTGIEVYLADPSPEAVSAAVERVREETLEAVYYLPWYEARRNLYVAMETERKAMFLVESLLILIASFNVTATLYMVVARKSREIAMLCVLGLSPRGVLALFALEGTLLGGLGAAIGLAVGGATCAYLDAFPLSIPGGGEVYYIAQLPVAPSAGLFAATAFLAVAMTFLAALLPARAASAIEPAEELRHG